MRVGVDSTGNPSVGPAYFGRVAPDGSATIFVSDAEDLVAVDTNQLRDVFVHEWATGSTERVSVSSTGAQGNGHSGNNSSTGSVALSLGGRYAAFMSDATNLVPGDTNDRNDVFVRDRQTGQTTRVSVDSSGVQGNEHSGMGGVAMTPDGRYVAFASVATNFGGAPFVFEGIFVHDRQTGQTSYVSRSTTGASHDFYCLFPAISADGRHVAFCSLADNLVPSDTNGWDYFVHDELNGTTVRVNVDSAGAQANEGSVPGQCGISADGRFVAFNSFASNLVANDTNATRDTFVRDLSMGTTVRANLDSSGAQANGGSGHDAAISADGRYVAFESAANNLTPGDANGFADVFVRDTISAATSIVSLASSGAQGDSNSWMPSISSDGRYVSFGTDATNLVPGPAPLGQVLRDRQGCSVTVATFCTAATSTHGCVPSIAVSGTPSATAGSGFALSVSGVEGQKTGMLFYGLSGSLAAPFGGGASLLCVRGSLQRMGLQNSGGTALACDGALSVDWNQFIATTPWILGLPFVGGESVWAQGWYRDPLAPGASNLSNAVWFTVCP